MEIDTNRILRLRAGAIQPENPFPMSLIVNRKGNGEYIYSARKTTPFEPYVDPFINMTQNPFTEDTRGEHEDYLIGTLVNRVITTQAVSLAEGKDYYEDFEHTFFDEDKVPEMYKIRSNSGFYLNDKSLPKKNQLNAKRGRKKKSKAEESAQYRETSMIGELPAGSEQFIRADGTLMITLTVNMMRQYMFTEVEARARHVNEYYRRQWDIINRERMRALSDLIECQETNRKLTVDLSEREVSLSKNKAMNGDLLRQIAALKEARKRRRQTKKQRKSESALGCNDDNMDDENEADAEAEGRGVTGKGETANTNNNGDPKKADK